MTVALLILAIAATLAWAAFCAGAETAFLSVSRERVLHLARAGGRKAQLVQRALSDMGRTMTTLLIGNNLASVAYSAVTAALSVLLFSNSVAKTAWSFFAAFLVEQTRLNAPFFNAGVWFALALWLACCVAMAALKRPYSKEWNLFPLFCLYLFAMTLVGIGACSCAVSSGGRFWIAAIGFVLFLLSDEAIGLNRISGIPRANWNDIIWTLYPLGVIGVILGV